MRRPPPSACARLTWICTTVSAEERAHAALGVAAALYSTRLPGLELPPAPEDWRSTSGLIQFAARRRYSALEAIETRRDAPLVRVNGSIRLPATELSENRRVVESAVAWSGGDERAAVYGLVGRPGKGGRQVRNWRAQLTQQSIELLEWLGEAFEHRRVAGGVIVMRWLVDPDGDSCWLIRLSPTSHEKAQETAMQQLSELEKQREEGLLKTPRWIVVTLNNSGGRLPEERYDLLLVREWIEEGWLRLCACRNEKRLARQEYTLSWCRQLFESTGTRIYFTVLRRPINWRLQSDRMLFTLNSMMASEDRIGINEQTLDGLDRRYTNEGKGWPGLQKVGLMRDPLSGFMVEDEVQTEMILIGARMWAGMSGRKSGIKQMARQMRDQNGFELSPKQWERVFKDEGYVTGNFSFQRNGVEVPLRHIELVNPIPPSLFAQLQEAFATNQGSTRSRAGDFVLLRGGAGQDVPASERGVFCKRCGQKLGAWLQGDLNDTRYRHASPVPECCRGRGGIERAVIEGVVMPELWRLESVLELREAAVRAAASEDVRVSAYLDAEQRRQCKRDIDDLEREINRLGREYRRLYLHNGKAARSRKNHIEAYHELVDGLKEDKRVLEERLKASDALEAVERSIAPTVQRGLGEALREVLTVDVPADDAACRRRAAAYGRMVTKTVLDWDDDGSFEVEIYGPLIPRDLPLLSVPAPSKFAVVELEQHRRDREREKAGTPARRKPYGDAREDIPTRPELRASSEGAPCDEACNRRYAWLHRASVAAPPG